jgi:hypothetical protein
MTEIKNGALSWKQYTDRRSLLEAGVRTDGLGFDTPRSLKSRLPD